MISAGLFSPKLGQHVGSIPFGKATAEAMTDDSHADSRHLDGFEVSYFDS